MADFQGNQYTENEYDDYTREELITDVQSLAAELDRPPTTRDVRDDDRFPCLRRIYSLVDADWQTVLASAGLESGSSQIDAYDPDERLEMVADLRRANDETRGGWLTTREYDNHGRYATSTIKEFFGSWSAACDEAGIEAGQKHGQAHQGPNGERLESGHELAVANLLDARDIAYVSHRQVEETNWRCDFYLPDHDIWVEVDGYAEGTRPNAASFESKLEYYETNEMVYLVVPDVSTLEEKLLGQGVLSD